MKITFTDSLKKTITLTYNTTVIVTTTTKQTNAKKNTTTIAQITAKEKAIDVAVLNAGFGSLKQIGSQSTTYYILFSLKIKNGHIARFFIFYFFF